MNTTEQLLLKYNGEFGSLEADLAEKDVKDAIQWPLVAEKANYKADEFLNIVRKILNEMFQIEGIDYDFKNKSLLHYEIERYLNPEYGAGAIAIEIVHNYEHASNPRENYILHLNFRNNSYLE